MSWASWRLAHAGAAMVLSVIAVMPAAAGGIGTTTCFGGPRSYSCVSQWGTPGDPNVRTIPDSLSETEQAYAMARDHKWLARCKPVVERDNYGVAHYRYAAPGCEFGVGAD
jgi:hypothetical protein